MTGLSEFNLYEQKWICEFVGACARGEHFDVSTNPPPSHSAGMHAAKIVENSV